MIGRLRGRKQSRGQGLVEFALVAPILFLMFFGILEFGRFVLYYHTLNNAVREGARYAIVHGFQAIDGCPSGPMPGGAANPCDPSGSNVRQAVADAAVGLLSVSDLSFPAVTQPDGTVCSSPANPCYYGPNGNSNARGSNVTLEVDYTYSAMLPLLPNIGIHAETTLVVNN